MMSRIGRSLRFTRASLSMRSFRTDRR
jgi:hypothetical protein